MNESKLEFRLKRLEQEVFGMHKSKPVVAVIDPEVVEEVEEEPDEGFDLNILDNNISDLKEAIKGLSEKHILALLTAEQNGKTRSGAIAALEDALKDL
jgi:hypothetical protein